MGFVFTLSGSRGVGKSHIINQLSEIYDMLYIRESRTSPITNIYDTSVEEEYYANERLYINKQVEEYWDIKKSDTNALLVRGPEDLRFYIENFPKTIGKTWDVEKNLIDELKSLDECKSDLIVFLYAEKEVIKKRCKNDSEKKRTTIDYWLKNWHDDIVSYMRQKENCIFIDTSNLTIKEVLECIISLIQKTIQDGMK